MVETSFRLPDWAHLPGVTAAADMTILDEVKRSVPARWGDTLRPDQPALRYGLDLYAAGFFWEAHEILEAVWMATSHNGADRLALRAIIQLANAGLKRRMGRRRATIRLLTEACDLLDETGVRRSEVGFASALDIAQLVTGIRSCITRVDGDHTQDAMPTIIVHPCTKMHEATAIL